MKSADSVNEAVPVMKSTDDVDGAASAVKRTVLKWIDIVLESVVYVIISYALTSMAMNFSRFSLFYFLFSVADLAVATKYWEVMREKTESGIITAVLLACCVCAYLVVIFSVGYISGTLVPIK